MAKKKTTKKAEAASAELTIECCDDIACKAHCSKKHADCPEYRALCKKLQLAAQAVANHLRDCAE